MTPKEKANQLTQKYAINTPIGFFIEECKMTSSAVNTLTS